MYLCKIVALCNLDGRFSVWTSQLNLPEREEEGLLAVCGIWNLTILLSLLRKVADSFSQPLALLEKVDMHLMFDPERNHNIVPNKHQESVESKTNWFPEGEN